MDLRRVRVSSMQRLALDILSFDLVSTDGRPLKPFTPGAHIDVHVPNGIVRQYSLCGDPEATDRYVVAVKREPTGRGGSIGMHDRVEIGSSLAIAGPKNNFPLVAGRHPNIFIAGGIGITPIKAMIDSLHAAGQDWELHYCARSQDHAAFYEQLKSLAPERTQSYFSELPVLDIATLTHEQPSGAHLYCCGPAGLMSAVADATSHWTEGHVHFEWFAGSTVDAASNEAFEVEMKQSGVVLTVPPEKSILEVLREHGFSMPSSCEDGVCGTCETAVLCGEIDHRDVLLSQVEREASRTMMICVSRARGGRLVLDA